MNTVRLMQRVALSTLAVVLLAGSAAAQDDTEADNIWVDGDKTIVIMSDEGRRMIIRSADDEGARFFFDSDDFDGLRFFDAEPGRFGYRWRTPKTVEFHGDIWDEDRLSENMAVLEGHLENLGGVWTRSLGDDIRFGIAGSSKERSEVMQMEMESRRLAQRARRAEGEERTRLEDELAEKLQEIFDRKQALREEQIDRLREELDEALDKHNDRSGNRNEIIDRRMRQLLGKEDKYDW